MANQKQTRKATKIASSAQISRRRSSIRCSISGALLASISSSAHGAGSAPSWRAWPLALAWRALAFDAARLRGAFAAGFADGVGLAVPSRGDDGAGFGSITGLSLGASSVARLRSRTLSIAFFTSSISALAHGFVELAAEFGRRAAKLAGVVAEGAHQLGQLLGPDHDDRDHGDDEKLRPTDIEHVCRFRRGPRGLEGGRECPRAASPISACAGPWRGRRFWRRASRRCAR